MLQIQTKISLLVAIMCFLGTVAPVIVSAENSAVIVNSVYSSSQTGGNGESGVAGVDGEDGQDGQDGTDGANGSSGQSGASSASASVTNYVNGSESHTVVVTATSGSATAQSNSTVFATTSHNGESNKETNSTSSEAPESRLFSLLLLLQETLTAYVQKLF